MTQIRRPSLSQSLEWPSSNKGKFHMGRAHVFPRSTDPCQCCESVSYRINCRQSCDSVALRIKQWTEQVWNDSTSSLHFQLWSAQTSEKVQGKGWARSPWPGACCPSFSQHGCQRAGQKAASLCPLNLPDNRPHCGCLISTLETSATEARTFSECQLGASPVLLWRQERW